MLVLSLFSVLFSIKANKLPKENGRYFKEKQFIKSNLDMLYLKPQGR